MKRRTLLLAACGAVPALAGCAAHAPTSALVDAPANVPIGALAGTGDLGVVIERARGALAIVNTSTRTLLAEVPGLGDLSHASVVFSRDGASAFVFGRDGALTRVDLLRRRIETRVMQAGNSIGGAISADGTLVAAQNYVPGGVKVFDARTLQLLAEQFSAAGVPVFLADMKGDLSGLAVPGEASPEALQVGEARGAAGPAAGRRPARPEGRRVG